MSEVVKTTMVFERRTFNLFFL